MVNPIRIILAAILLGCLLYYSSRNPFIFIPPYIDMPALLEMLCCIAVAGAICYAVAVYWRGANANDQEEARGTKSLASAAPKVLKAAILAFAAYMACVFLALLFHYFVGFDSGIAVAYTLVVFSILVAAEALLRRLPRTSSNIS